MDLRFRGETDAVDIEGRVGHRIGKVDGDRPH